MRKYFTKKKIKDILTITLGVFLMSFSYSIFIDPNNMIVGGVGGIATLVKSLLKDTLIFGIEVKSSYIILILNVILLLFGLFFVSKDFFLKTLYASIINPIFVWICEIAIKAIGPKFINLVNVSNELTINLGISENATNVIMAGANLLFIIFGAIICGYGLGLTLKKGASTGGIDILQRIFLKYFKIPFSVSLILIDGTIVLTSCIIYQNILIAIYGIAFIIISGTVVDSVAFSGFNSRSVNIITSKPLEVKQMIYDVINRGVTELRGRGGYTYKDFVVLVCVMSNNEFYKIKSLVLEIDDKAFIYVNRASEVHGEGFSFDSPN